MNLNQKILMDVLIDQQESDSKKPKRKRLKFIKAGSSSPVFIPRKCKHCGCHENMACFHPELGNCSWATKEECSHCVKERKGHVMGVIRPWINNKP